MTVALPGAFAANTPVEETTTTFSLSEDQVTDLSVASSGETVAFRNFVSPSVIVSELTSRTTPSTEITLALTVTVQVAVLPPSSDFAVTVALQGFVPVTMPSETVTSGLSEDHITFLFVALPGETVAMMRALSPSVNSSIDGLSVMPVTATVSGSFWQAVIDIVRHNARAICNTRLSFINMRL